MAKYLTPIKFHSFSQVRVVFPLFEEFTSCNDQMFAVEWYIFISYIKYLSMTISSLGH